MKNKSSKNGELDMKISPMVMALYDNANSIVAYEVKDENGNITGYVVGCYVTNELMENELVPYLASISDLGDKKES